MYKLINSNCYKFAGAFCSGDLIFEDTFDTFDVRKWQHENTLAGGSVSR